MRYALACMLRRAGFACSAALGSFSSCLARTPCSILVPRFLSTLCQYSKARTRTGSVTPLSRWPTTLLTSRSRAAASITSRTRVTAVLDRVVQVTLVVVGVGGGHLVAFVLGEELDALVGLEVVLDPEPLAGGVDPHVGVGGIPVHVPPGPGDAAVAHQPGHLVRRFRRQGPEVPLHVVVAQVVVRAAFLGADEVLELHRVAQEEHRGVVPDHVVVALGRVELDREASGVPPGVGAAPLPGHGG